MTYLRWDTGEIMATRDRIADDAQTLPCHISTAMTDLERIGAIIRQRRGKRTVYFMNGNVAWAGSERTRQAAVKGAPVLRLVSKNKAVE